jgi:hypothetical protein
VVAGFLVGNLFRTVRDLMGRRHHAWRQDAFAGQSSLWLSLLAPVLVVGDLEAWEGWWWVPAVVVGIMAAASITAAALTCERGVRRRWGLGVTAGMGAALWFGPILVVMWGSDAQLSGKAVGTLVLVLGMVVPVLAVVAMPAVCGGVVLRAWALGVVLASARVWAAMSARLGPLFPPPIQLVVWPVCAVVVALVVSGMLRNP